MNEFKAVVFDIDGTLVEPVSSWRYIHEKLDLWDSLACRYQEKFLSGKISYKKFCELDAKHWRGLSEKKIKDIFAGLPYTRNAHYAVKKLKKMGFKLIAVSTGLQYVADRLKKEMGFDFCLRNELISRGGKLTGEVKINITHKGKGRAVGKILKKFRIKPEEVICVGDSAGDIPLAKLSGYAIGFNSSDKDFSKIVDYDCRTKDFREILEKITAVSREKVTAGISR